MALLYRLSITGGAVYVVYYLFVAQNVSKIPDEATPARKSHTVAAELKPPNPEAPPPASPSVLHIFERAAICSDSYACSDIGSNTLRQGGSAVDAALATLLCNGLVAMQSMGVGGGVLMNIYSRSEKRSYSVLSREVAPLAAHTNMYAEMQNLSSTLSQSSLSIAVPGEIMGYAVAHERFGKLPWSALVQPTVELCYAGYTLTKHQRDALYANKDMLSQDTHLRKMFWDSATKDFRRVGSHIKPPQELCHTYESLAKHGPRSFYNGSLASSIVADLHDFDSGISSADLSSFKANLTASVVLPLGDYLLHLTPPPGSGYIIGFVMNILNRYRKHFLRATEIGALEVHRMVEALKFGFVKRWELDMQLPRGYLENITCPDYAAELAALINDFVAFDDPGYYGADLELIARPEHGTAHISVLAANGDAVSATSSINFYFGNGRTGARTGVLFNNAMSDFSIDDLPNYFDLPDVQHKNRIKPGQSPMSSMAPLIVTTAAGDVRLVVGAAGGTKIISALTHLLVRTLWLRQNIKEAIDAARFHHQLLPDVLEYEYGIVKSVIEDLEARGHETRRYRMRGSAICGIEPEGGSIYANADYRKDGGVAGF